MAWTTPRTFVTAEIETAAIFNTHLRDNLNFLKAGVVASASVTASAGPTVGTTELLLATAPAVTVDGTTQIEVMFNWANVTLTVATDAFVVRIYDGAVIGSGTLLAQCNLTVGANGGGGTTRAIITPTAGAHTYSARLFRNAGTGTATMIAAASTPAYISVAQVN